MARLRTLLTAGLIALALPAAPAAALIQSGDPLPRFEDALCPGVMGMDTGSALAVLDRIRANAEKLKIRLADPDKCAPNLLIAFVEDGGKTVDTLMNSQPQLFMTLTVQEKRDLRAGTGPVYAWNVVATRTRDGMFVPRREDLTFLPQATLAMAHSKIYVPTRQDIVSSVVLFDSKAIKGMTLQQLADYVSIRAFAVDFAAYDSMQGPSILTLFGDGGGAAAELTARDWAFLTTLYSGIPNLPTDAKRLQLALETEKQDQEAR